MTWVWVGMIGALAALASVIVIPRTRRLVGRAITVRHSPHHFEAPLMGEDGDPLRP
jgi:hypothetical protein